MNRKFALQEIFPTWYKSAESSITPEVLANRIAAIKKILSITEIDFWLDIVRVALEIKIEDNSHINTFVKKFQEFDVNFPVTGNDNLVKVLAQITLCELFDKKNEASFIVGNAIIVANFFETYKTSEIPFFSKAKDNISSFKEEPTELNSYLQELTNLEDTIVEDTDSLTITNNDVINLIRVNNILLTENLNVKQESNILWWLFGEYSSIFDDYFTNVGVPKMIVASALELHGLNVGKSVAKSSKHILVKALVLSNNNNSVIGEVDILSVINMIPIEKMEMLLNEGLCEELTPILLAFKMAKELGEKNWQKTYLKKLKLKNLEKKYKPGVLAYQLFSELRLVKSLND